MPVMDGWEFRMRQKEDPELTKVPVLVVTAIGATVGIDAVCLLHKAGRCRCAPAHRRALLQLISDAEALPPMAVAQRGSRRAILPARPHSVTSFRLAAWNDIKPPP
jgi:hypothetical protein